jgi:hypothetical protein
LPDPHAGPQPVPPPRAPPGPARSAPGPPPSRRQPQRRALHPPPRLPVPAGTKVFIEATMQAVLGRKIWSTAEGRLNSPDGPLAVESGSLYMQVPQEHFDRHRGITAMDSTLLDIAP